MKPKKIFAAAAVAAVLILTIAAPQRYSAACLSGIALWAKAVLPALFPFFVLTAVLTRLGAANASARLLAPLARKFRLPGIAAYCFLLSALSGYPVGSRLVADLTEGGALPKESAARVAVLCSTSGPMFLVGSVGGAMFQSAAAGAVLLASHILGILAVCLLALPFARKPGRERRQNVLPTAAKADDVLRESVHGAVISILCVGGTIALFYVFAQALADVGALALLARPLARLLRPFGAEQLADGFVSGLLEATRGCAALAGAGGTLALPLCAFLVTFGGACILAQQLGYLRRAGVKSGFFVACKALQGAAAFAICLGLSALFL